MGRRFRRRFIRRFGELFRRRFDRRLVGQIGVLCDKVVVPHHSLQGSVEQIVVVVHSIFDGLTDRIKPQLSLVGVRGGIIGRRGLALFPGHCRLIIRAFRR